MSNITQMRVKGVDYDLSNLVNSTKTNSLENLDCSKNLIQATVSKATNFSLSGEMQVGQKIKLFIISNGSFVQTISGDNIKTDFGKRIKLNTGDVVLLNIECYDTNKYFIVGRGVNPMISYILVSTNSSGSATIDKYTNPEGTETERITIPASSTDYKVDDLVYGFKTNAGNHITKIRTTQLDTSNVIKMKNMFSRCSALTSLNLSNWNTSNVTDMGYMFVYCTKLTSLNLSNWNTSNVIKMSSMFESCTKLTSLDVSHFDTSNVTSMINMFVYCTKLTSLNLSNWNTSNVTNMGTMFSNCSSLTSLDVSHFDTSKVTIMSGMFWSCTKLTSLDLSNWNTSNVTSMSSMFRDCSSLTSLDVSHFDTSKVTKAINMSNMFLNCSSLNHIKCKQAFKDWCWTNQDTIKLPTAMREGGSGTWEIVG